MTISQFQYEQMLARTEKQRVPPKDVPNIAESELHEKIAEYCRLKGWLAVHSRMDKPTTQALGVTDFIVVRPCTVLFIEVKRKGRKPTMEQLAFGAQIKKLGWPHAVVYSFQEFLNFVTTCKTSPSLAAGAEPPSK